LVIVVDSISFQSPIAQLPISVGKGFDEAVLVLHVEGEELGVVEDLGALRAVDLVRWFEFGESGDVGFLFEVCGWVACFCGGAGGE